ncbi:Uncharacterised protein [Mycobacterium tuberculosis]|uniref:Uncharacterized protein n=1 Tax=Mycobacterium tuberculosis TaxID=1773 RepID=A0A654TGG3_MYCTX|nr:Uncharacterised protein [Mycobacterium tuberculosis]CKR55059.1 Uncharacterised protein [Mycobacterium tuberculosis]CKU13758.1 Uncharacterised protein [Mycobacterium tuberculosis]CNN11793.1 Uncharacterised protein [Mycobacterium tuberculosis]COV03511.1 Uncharacterised protein [Mycobacterium tuberculosis]
MQVEILEPGRHPLDVPQVGVVLDASRLVGAAEADQVGREHTVPGGGERRNHGSVQITPGGLAVQQDDRRTVARALVDVVHSQRLGVAGRHIDIVRCKRVAHQVFEPGVWGA